jgi:NADH-quinone oxidoreductase subunit A
MLSNYLPILVFILLGLAFGCVPLIIGKLVRPNAPYTDKNASYECGFEPFEEARLPFDVKFYLIAILFILFDLETAFLFPWAISMQHLGWFGMISMGIFVAILLVGFIYEWKKGALEWQ